MASGFLWIYLGALLIIVAGFIGMGAGVYRRNRKRGAMVGLIGGIVIGPLINNALFFDSGPTKEPAPIVYEEN
jgi:hypothetical protein